MEDREVGRLGYNPSNDRYGILVMDLWEVEGCHCGQCFDVYVPGRYVYSGTDTEIVDWADDPESTWIEGHWVDDSIEYDWNGKGWYLVKTKLHGEQLEYVRVSNW